jgi:hypothetical protein
MTTIPTSSTKQTGLLPGKDNNNKQTDWKTVREKGL